VLFAQIPGNLVLTKDLGRNNIGGCLWFLWLGLIRLIFTCLFISLLGLENLALLLITLI